MTYGPEEKAMIDACVEHGMTEKDALRELVALFRQGNKGPYTARVRRVLSLEGLYEP